MKRFGKEVREELKSKVVGKAYRGGLEKTKLEVVNVVEGRRGNDRARPVRGHHLHPRRATRSSNCPNTSGCPTSVQPVEPTEAEVDAVIEGLRQERADFKVAERPAQKGDYVKLAYEGTIDGKPVAELAPDKQIYGKVPADVGGGRRASRRASSPGSAGSSPGSRRATRRTCR